jgi:hypothetical protein
MIERFSFEQGEEKVRKWNVQRLLQSTCWRITGSGSGFRFKALGWMISVKPLPFLFFFCFCLSPNHSSKYRGQVDITWSGQVRSAEMD